MAESVKFNTMVWNNTKS